MNKPVKVDRVAFLDVDRTLVNCFLLIELANRLTEEGFFNKEIKNEILENTTKYQQKKLSYQNTVSKNTTLFSQGLKNQDVQEIRGFAYELFAKKKKEWYFSYTIPLIKLLKNINFKIVLISASPAEIIYFIAKDLGVKYFALESGSSRDSYTGEVSYDLVVANKQEIIMKYTKKYKINPQHCLAISDGAGDISMLEAVGLAIALNPDPVLEKVAQEKEWPIVRDGNGIVDKIEKIIQDFLQKINQ